MVLFGYEEMEKKNLESRRVLQEMEMEMKMGCDGLRTGIKMEKETGEKNGDFVEELEVGEENPNVWEDENGVVGEEGSGFAVGGYNKDTPPVDDVCPICFDRFTVPCKSSCGHWFCASCILHFWVYRSSIQPCKCPLCCCLILNLNPEASQLIRPPDDIVKVLQKVKQYNDLYIDGVHGIFLSFRALPFFMRRKLELLINPHGLRCVYYVMRLLGLLLALLYEKAEFEFIPTGGLGIQRTFDMGASMLVVALFLVGIGRRWVLKSRERHAETGLHERGEAS